MDLILWQDGKACSAVSPFRRQAPVAGFPFPSSETLKRPKSRPDQARIRASEYDKGASRGA